MPVCVTLCTAPATATQETWGTTLSLDLFGPSLGVETLPAVSNVAEIKVAVARFGAKIRAEHPQASFYVSVRLAKGSRKPNGYDAASRGNGLGQEDFIHVTGQRTTAAVPAAPGSALPERAGA